LKLTNAVKVKHTSITILELVKAEQKQAYTETHVSAS
jgi:hypothetical protein